MVNEGRQVFESAGAYWSESGVFISDASQLLLALSEKSQEQLSHWKTASFWRNEIGMRVIDARWTIS